MEVVVVTTGAINRAKLQSNHHHRMNAGNHIVSLVYTNVLNAANLETFAVQKSMLAAGHQEHVNARNSCLHVAHTYSTCRHHATVFPWRRRKLLRAMFTAVGTTTTTHNNYKYYYYYYYYHCISLLRVPHLRNDLYCVEWDVKL